MDKKAIMKIVLFDSILHEAGGEERLMFEHARFLLNQGHEVWILTLCYHPDVLFDKYYDIPIIALSDHKSPENISFIEKLKLMFSIKIKIKKLKPDIIIGQLIADCGILFLTTLFSNVKYVIHIHGTIMWLPEENTKYSFLHRKTMKKLRKQVIGHQQFYPEIQKSQSLAQTIIREFNTFIRYIGICMSENIFTLSRLMANEIFELYGKSSVVLKGAYEPSIFDHKITHSLKSDLNLTDKRLILNINRLDPRKRVDMLIKAFSMVEYKIEDTYLVIGGKGQEEFNLKNQVWELNLDRVLFLGFVPEEKLFDYYATCDLFVHPNWAEYAISVYEALAMGCKIVCSNEMEFDRELLKYTQIFTSTPTPGLFAGELLRALEHPNHNPIPFELLKQYSWDNYFHEIGNYLVT